MEGLLDIRTIILTLAFGNLVFGVVLILLQTRREHRLRNDFWTAAKFLQGLGWLLLAGRDTIADVLSYTLGDFCLLAGFAYECWAIFRISNRPVPPILQGASLIYALLGVLLATPLAASGRLAVSTLLSVPILALAAWAMLRGGSRSSPLRAFMGWSIGLLALTAGIRGFMALATADEFILFSRNPIQFVSFAILFYLMLANGISMLVLSKEQTDQRLQEAMQEQKAILDALPTGLCILRDRVIVQCNPAMEAMFGFLPGTLPGRSVRCLYENEEMFEAFGRVIYAEIEATGRFEGEVLYRRHNGERFWAKDHGQTIVFGDHRPETYTVFSVIDISEQKRQQELLTRRNEEVEASLARIKRLEGIISICMYCKKIRTEEDAWEQLEKYITAHSDARFSHGICPDCYSRSLREQI